jgi:hypothetical protein
VLDFLPFLIYFAPFCDRLCILAKYTNGFENAEMPMNQPAITCGQFSTV